MWDVTCETISHQNYLHRNTFFSLKKKTISTKKISRNCKKKKTFGSIPLTDTCYSKKNFVPQVKLCFSSETGH